MSELLAILFMPPDLSEHGAGVDSLMLWVHVIMAVLFVGWGLFFLYTLIRFRSKRNPQANYAGVQSHASTYHEVAVTVVEGVLLILLAIPLWAERVEDFPDEKDAMVVRVIGKQFNWQAHYPGPDGKFGRLNYRLVHDMLNPLGLDPDDENGKDDLVADENLFAIPVNKPIIIHLTSKDVIHSLSIPTLRVKQDAIPGMSIPIWFKALKTSKQYKEEEAQRTGKSVSEIRDLEVACAQLCGAQHYKMRGYLHILEEKEFEDWLQQWKEE